MRGPMQQGIEALEAIKAAPDHLATHDIDVFGTALDAADELLGG